MKLLLVLFLALLLAPASGLARTINWGSDPFSILLDSQGQPLDDSFVFELGSFGGFNPTADNMASWRSNWSVFDRASAPEADGWNSSIGYFTSSATVEPDGTSSAALGPDPVFVPGSQAYIWVYDSLVYDVGSEWGLITRPDWQMPAPGSHTDFPLTWSVQTADTVVFGGVNDTQGAGTFIAPPSSFQLQTHNVPEPGGVVLMGVVGFLYGLRRRRP